MTAWRPGDPDRRSCPRERTWTDEELRQAKRVLLLRSKWRHSLEAISQNKLAAALLASICVALLGAMATAGCNVVRAAERLDVERVMAHVSSGDERDKRQDAEIGALNEGLEHIVRHLEATEARAAKRDELTARMLANQEAQGKQLDRVVGVLDNILRERRPAQ